jgi:hypothetical protein
LITASRLSTRTAARNGSTSLTSPSPTDVGSRQATGSIAANLESVRDAFPLSSISMAKALPARRSKVDQGPDEPLVCGYGAQLRANNRPLVRDIWPLCLLANIGPEVLVCEQIRLKIALSSPEFRGIGTV